MTTPRLLFLQGTSVFERYGGIEYYLDDFVTLAGECYGFDNVCALVPERAQPLNIIERPYPIHKVQLSTKPLIKRFENRFSVRYFRKALKVISEFKPTCLVCGHVSLGPMVYLLHRLKKVPFVTVAYGFECWGDMWPQDEWCFKKTQAIVSISYWTKGVLVKRGYDPSHIVIVHPRLTASYERLEVGEKDTSKPFTLLSISRLDPSEQYKGQDHVLHALSKLNLKKMNQPVKYIIQGEGGDKGRLQGLVKELGLEEFVEFRPRVSSRDDLNALYREADLYVMPSRFGRWDGRWRGEGFGIVFLEAAAYRVPSVAYRCGGVMDIIQDGKNGVLVEPDNIDALAETLRSFLTDRNQTKRMGEVAYRMVQENFTRPALKQQIVNAFEPM